MITVEELTGAMELRNDELRRELKENRKVMANVQDWGCAIDAHIDAVIKNFEVVGVSEVVIEWDPDDGRPYACIKVTVDNYGRKQMKAYQQYVRQISDVKYLDLIVLDVMARNDQNVGTNEEG